MGVHLFSLEYSHVITLVFTYVNNSKELSVFVHCTCSFCNKKEYFSATKRKKKLIKVYRKLEAS